jgi:hypothetical protein
MVVEYIKYKHGMINKPSQRKKLKAGYLDKDNIPDEITKLITEKDILSITGTLGNKEGAMPIEYEEIKIRADGKETRFEIYNKGMSMFTNETDELKRVFEFCTRLQRKLRL